MRSLIQSFVAVVSIVFSTDILAAPVVVPQLTNTGAIPKSFVAGNAAVADEVNSNFKVLVDAINALAAARVGTVIASAGSSSTMPCPTGSLLANGDPVSRTTYNALYAFIGNAHGSGDGTTTFNLPDYRGRFLRGVDGAAGNDPDSASRAAMKTGGNTGNAVGSVQADAFQGHVHGNIIQASGAVYGGGATYMSQGVTGGPISDGTNGTPRISSESRPKNAYVNYCIYY